MEPSGAQHDAASILVVDDTLPNLELLSEMLKARGYKVRPVPSGDLALQAAKSSPPDLILLDIHMPEMDGYEVCERLKADEQLQDIPVLFISGLSEITDKVKAFRVGGADYITKPFQFEEVEARVATHLELRRQRRQLLENYEQLQKLESLREDMTAMLVHDLKNPLVSSSMALQAVLRRQQPASCLTPDERGFLEVARDSQARLAGMIDDMLQIARAEGGQMPLERTELDLCEIAEAAVHELEPRAQRAQLRVVHEGGGPVPVNGDAQKLRRVADNLLTNAVKFTPAGGTVTVGAGVDGPNVWLQVRDTGPGIAAELQETVFEKFAQAGTKQRMSVGLGLTFCKLVAEAHGGTVSLDSKPGEGSTFTVTIPSGMG